jgi:alpha-galactosidase
MDIDEERLSAVYSLARRYSAEMDVELSFQRTMSREVSLEDADFVVNTALIGGHRNQDIRRSLGEKHSYYRGVELGRYHQLRFFLDVARDMEKICPEAWLIQCANPVFEGCTLLTRQTDIKVVGLCHGHYGVLKIAETLGLDLGEVTFQAPGFNHCIWMTHFFHKGKDAYPFIDEWIERESDVYWRDWDPKYHETQMSPAAVDMYKMFGLFPIGDTARNGGWWYHSDLETKKRWYGPLGGFDSEVGWNQYLTRLNKRVDEIFRVAKSPSESVIKHYPPKKSREQHVPLIDALANDREGVFQVNIPNQGAIPDIPDDVVVEILGVVSGRGIQGVHISRLPSRLMLHVLIPRMLKMEWILEGFLTGDRKILLHLLLQDHRTSSLEQAEAFLEDVMSSPINRDLAEHYG